MKKYFVIIIFAAGFFMGCKKNNNSGNTSGSGNNPSPGCYLSFFKFSDRAPVWQFEYTAKGKLSKTRYFSNGPLLPATRVFEYDVQNQLTKISDSISAGYYTEFSAHNTMGNPTKGLTRFGGKKGVELEFMYDAKQNISKKIFQFYNSSEILLPNKDTLLYYYDGNGNITKETAITSFNGVRREYILLEAEGYDNKISYYKSLGIEFNLLYRFNRSGEGTYNLGEYIYGLCANNPGKVYLHNRGLDDNNKGDYFTYTYEYSANNYPSKISQTYTTSSGTGSALDVSFKYECK